jgi:hypothetical protein
MLRVTSEFWVSAYLRKIEANGAFGCLLNKGAGAAGAIFVILNHMDGNFSLFEPAPQISFDDDDSGERKFLCVHDRVEESKVNEKIVREKKFDSDIWVVEIEDNQGRHMLDVVKI